MPVMDLSASHQLARRSAGSGPYDEPSNVLLCNVRRNTPAAIRELMRDWGFMEWD